MMLDWQLPMEKPAMARPHLSLRTRYFFSSMGMQFSIREWARPRPESISPSYSARCMPSFITTMKGTALPSAIRLSMM